MCHKTRFKPQKHYIPEFRVVLKKCCKSLFFKGSVAELGVPMANQMGQALNQSGSGQVMGNQSAIVSGGPQSPKYYAALGGKQAGPFDMATLQEHVQSGQLTKQTLVWREGMKNWIPAEQVAELNSLFDSVPPPLPS